ncbi:MAG: M56 family metallopeptidase [Lachnospiraceae bacterium]|nr:M56 family metallopeptidase [Lachnospiraceae bacterium]
MEGFILQLGIMSVQAAIVICVVLLVRILFTGLHVPKKYMMLLWFIPYILMICPWKIESSFSFWQVMEHEQIDKVQTALQHVQNGLEQDIEETEQTQDVVEAVRQDENTGNVPVNGGEWNGAFINNGVGCDNAIGEDTLNGTSDGAISNNGTPSVGTMYSVGTGVTDLTEQDSQTTSGMNINSMEFVTLLLQVGAVLWLAGVAAILLYSIVSYVKLKRKILCSICVSENIYYADDIDSPFVLGIFKPRIYLPSSMKQENLHYVLEHERTHIRKWDPLKKMLAFCISVIHWFNPFAWVAFYFFSKDMEMACDEETITRLGIENKQDYATALLQLASGKRVLLGAPLAFGEGNVKGRIRNIVKYKKVWRIVSVAAIVVIAILAVGFLTQTNATTTLAKPEGGEPDNAKEEQNPENTQEPESTKEPIGQEKEPFSLPEGAVQVAITKPILTEETENGIEGPYLDYASESMIIFHDHYGLFVYSKEKGLIGEIDLHALGMEQLQGSNAWSVEVEADGSRIYMHGMEDEDMYVYDVEQNVLYRQKKYDVSDIEMFHGLVDWREYIEPDYTVARSIFCVPLANDYYHYLESGSGLPVDMCWVIRQYPQTEKATAEYIKIFDSYEGEWSALYSDARHEMDVEKNLNKQLSLIASQKESWMMKTAYDLENYGFAVTDLDNNGRLEIISSQMHGRGQVSDNKIFEVSDDYEELIRVKTNYAEGESQPDILADTITAYRDETGIHYIAYDYNNEVEKGTYESYQSLQFVNGQLTGRLLGRKSTEFQQGKGLVTTYYDGEGRTITEEEYHQMVEKTFHNAYQFQVNMGWQDVAEFDEVSEQDLKKALQASLAAFNVRRVSKENVVGAYPGVEETPEAFTMVDLIELFKEDKVAETMRNYVEQDGILPSNIRRSYQEGALSWHYYYDLEYQGKSYTLRAYYWNPENAQENGHAPNQLYEVILYENSAGDALMLYSNDYRHAGAIPLMDIEEFLAKEYGMEQYLSLKLPEGTYLRDYSMLMNDIFQGSLIQFLEDYEGIPHEEWAPEAWYAPGGVGMVGEESFDDRATFEDGKLVGFRWLMTHGGGEVVEVLEDCDMPAVLYHYNFDVFTLPEGTEYAEKHGISMDEVPWLSDYWYVFFAEPESDCAYVVFLNQAYFTKEDILELARSVKFK